VGDFCGYLTWVPTA